MTTTASPARIAQIAFETEMCTRCGGTGEYPSACWQGACLKCSRAGVVYTRAGKAAKAAYEAYLAKHHSRLPIDLQPGDQIRKERGRWVTVHAVDPELRRGGTTTIGAGENAVSWSSLHISYTTRKADGSDVLNYVMPYAPVIVRPRGEDAQAAFRAVAKRKGTIVTYHAE